MKKIKSDNLMSKKLIMTRQSIFDKGQIEVGASMKIGQSTMSMIENVQRQSFPLKYLTFLAENGVNLSAIFNNNVSLEDYSAICEGKSMLLLPEHVDCANCKIKDQIIIDLRDTIKILKDNIDLLNSKLTVIP